MKYTGDKMFYRKTARIAVPIIIQNGFTFLVNFVDNIMVGQLGTEAMSGVAIVNQLLFVFNICILGIIAGASIFGAQFYGSKDCEGLRETFRFRFFACVFMAVVALFLFRGFGEKLISLFLHSADHEAVWTTLGFGKEYLAILLLSLIPSAITQAYASTQKDMGETILPMCSGVAAVLLNTAMNYILIFGRFGCPALGVRGAAIATVTARLAECMMIVVVSHVRSGKYWFTEGAFRSMHISSDLMKKILMKGSPLMINEMFWSLGTVMMVQCYSVRGIHVVAGINIATTIYNVFSIIYLAIGSSIAIMIGQLLGAGKMEEARETDRKLIFLALASSVVSGLIIIASAPFYPGIYNTTEEVRTMAVQFMYILGICAPMAAYMHAAFFTIRAGGSTWITMLFDSSSLWLVSIPLAYVLTRYTDMPIVLVYGICQGADLLKCIFGFILVKKGIWLNNIVAAQR